MQEPKKTNEILLEMKGITKRFLGIVANDHVDLVLRYGEVHSILGENGAGKTTLMNILSGLYQPDEGEIFVDGRKVTIKSPSDAVKLGVGMVHQHLKLVDTLRVWENIIIGYEPTTFSFIRREEAKTKIRNLQQRFGLHVDLDAKPPSLAPCDRQKTEILKVLYRGARILILDEPTSLLTPNEKEKLIQTIKSMAAEGICSVPFITHKLPEVLELSTCLTVLRKGKVVATLDAKEIGTEESLAEKMVGRTVLFRLEKENVVAGNTMFGVEGIEAFDERGVKTLNGVSFSINEGEILGLAGVSGNGQRQLVQAIMGLLKPANGKIKFGGEDITGSSVCDRRAKGFAYIPDDKLRDGVIPDLSIKENILVGMHREDSFRNGFFINYNSAEAYAKRLVEEYNIDTDDVEKKVGKLSGGNIQKIVLARELSRNPSFILADKPTQGLDVGSQEFIRKVLLKERAKGKAILLISEDLDEILMVSDRVAVICQGKIVGEHACEETTKENIGVLMAGSFNAASRPQKS
jgi:general nucleoside transport system ATP-binding protein